MEKQGLIQQQQNNTQEAGAPNQDIYDIFVSQGILIVKQIAHTLKGKSSIDSLGNALFNIVSKIETEGEANGIKFPLDIIAHGSNEILGFLLKESGVEVDEQKIRAIIGIAVGEYIEDAMKTGKFTQEQIQEIAQSGEQAPEQPPVIDQPPMGEV